MIYMDNASTTPLSQSVKQDIINNFDNFGNPSSLYDIGYKSKEIIENARIKVAKAINAEPEQIIFTSGATESNNWVANFIENRYGVVNGNVYEHHSLTQNPNFEPIETSIKFGDSGVLTEMLVNNEIGFINNISVDNKLFNGYNYFTHSDITQAIGNIQVDVKDLNVDFASFSGHKFNAPKGVGALYVKNPNTLFPYHYGGQQENHFRAGTENILGISAMGVAIEEAVARIEKKQKHCKELRERFINNLTNYGLDFIVNGADMQHIDSILSLSFKNQDSQAMLVQLDMAGICASSGSACNSGDSEPSETLKWLGVPDDYIYGTLRFSFSLQNTLDEVNEVCYNINKIVKGE